MNPTIPSSKKTNSPSWKGPSDDHSLFGMSMPSRRVLLPAIRRRSCSSKRGFLTRRCWQSLRKPVCRTAFICGIAMETPIGNCGGSPPRKRYGCAAMPSLASGHLVLDRENVWAAGSGVTFRTRQAGTLEVRRIANGYELALPAIPTQRRPLAGSGPAAGRGTRRGVAQRMTAMASTWVASEADVRALTPDLARPGRPGE